MRYRLTYLHLPTRARLTFTLECPGLEGAARGAGSLWLHESGADPQEFAFLSVVEIGCDCPRAIGPREQIMGVNHMEDCRRL